MTVQTPVTSVAAPIRRELRLYVAGQISKSASALTNLKRICETYLKRQQLIEVIDRSKKLQLAAGEQIIAVLKLVHHLPEPAKKLLGDLSNERHVPVGFNILPMWA